MFRRYRTTRKALRVCDGVIEIAENEMLARGQYVCEEVSNPLRASQGAICGGHKACLVGSMFLAHGDLPHFHEVDHTLGTWDGIFTKNRDLWLATRPGLDLAYRAINTAAKETVDESYSGWSHHEIDTSPYKGWGEFFFERVLEYEDPEIVRWEIIGVVNLAKRMIKDREVS